MSMKNVDDCIVLHSKAWLVRDGYQVVNMYMLVKFVNVQFNIQLQTVCEVCLGFLGANVTPVVLLKNRTFCILSIVFIYLNYFSLLNPVLTGWFDLENKPCFLTKTSGLVCTTWELHYGLVKQTFLKTMTS